MKGLIYRQIVLLVTGVILLLFRWYIMVSPPVFQVVDNPASFENSLVIRVSITSVATHPVSLPEEN